jgi:hypothetical protein
MPTVATLGSWGGWGWQLGVFAHLLRPTYSRTRLSLSKAARPQVSMRQLLILLISYVVFNCVVTWGATGSSLASARMRHKFCRYYVIIMSLLCHYSVIILSLFCHYSVISMSLLLYVIIMSSLCLHYVSITSLSCHSYVVTLGATGSSPASA